MKVDVQYKFVKNIVLTRKRMSPEVDNTPFLSALEVIIGNSGEDLV